MPPQFADPVCSLVVKSKCLLFADATFTFPSVKLVVAVDPDAPVAATLYCATNQSGRLKLSAMTPASSAVTSTSRLQLLPESSLTRMWTTSPGPQRRQKA